MQYNYSKLRFFLLFAVLFSFQFQITFAQPDTSKIPMTKAQAREVKAKIEKLRKIDTAMIRVCEKSKLKPKQLELRIKIESGRYNPSIIERIKYNRAYNKEDAAKEKLDKLKKERHRLIQSKSTLKMMDRTKKKGQKRMKKEWKR